MTKIDSAEPSINSGPELVEGLVAGQNMFRKLEDLNFVIVSDFGFSASNFSAFIQLVPIPQSHRLRVIVVYVGLSRTALATMACPREIPPSFAGTNLWV